MNWKEFYKITISKFILFLIIITAGVVVKYISQAIYLFYSALPYEQPWFIYILYPFDWLLSHLYVPVILGTPTGAMSMILNSFILSISTFLDLLIWQYSISCLIIWIINKFKK